MMKLFSGSQTLLRSKCSVTGGLLAASQSGGIGPLHLTEIFGNLKRLLGILGEIRKITKQSQPQDWNQFKPKSKNKFSLECCPELRRCSQGPGLPLECGDLTARATARGGTATRGAARRATARGLPLLPLPLTLLTQVRCVLWAVLLLFSFWVMNLRHRSVHALRRMVVRS